MTYQTILCLTQYAKYYVGKKKVHVTENFLYEEKYFPTNRKMLHIPNKTTFIELLL